jgi:hypothetical protein
VHRPDAHPAVPLLTLHTAPHAPHALGLVPRLVSQPLPAWASQSAKPALQAATAQRPPTHAGAPLLTEHTTPQAPQAVAVVRVSTSQPLSGLPSQSAKPALHAATAQRPAAHDAVALGRLHPRPQAPQWVALDWVSVSQPLLSWPSQSPRPIAQAPTPHTPARHTGVPPEVMHALPHAPQWASLVRVSVSQPLPAVLSQSPKPVVQLATRHAPPAQAAVALARAHIAPQRPQCATLVAVSTSQPLVALPSQSAADPIHAAMPHTPAVQREAAPGALQALSQRPQWETLVARSKHPSPHTDCPPGQVSVHAPIAHTRPLAQALPQAPQWVLALRVSTSQPLAALPSQSPRPVAQAATAQAPLSQRAVAPASAQVMPQPPQWVALVRVSASQPLAALPSQSPYGAVHCPTAQRPLRQAAVALATLHRAPQAPQCTTLASGSMHAPSQHV